MRKSSDALKRPQRDGKHAFVETARLPPKAWNTLKYWTWQATPAYFTSIAFILGSLCLLFGSSARLWTSISANAELLRGYVLAPYFLGCVAPVQRTHLQLQLTRSQIRKRQKNRSEREAERARTQQYWARVDYIGAVMAVTGGLFINVASYIDYQKGSKAELILTANVSELWSITAPVMFGRGLFILAGYLAWAARNRSWSFQVKSSTQYFWWTTFLFTIGAGLFYWGFYVVESPFEFLPGIIVQNWFGVLTGYISGSCLLLSASYIMLLELANKDRQPAEPLEASLIMV